MDDTDKIRILEAKTTADCAESADQGQSQKSNSTDCLG